MLSDHPVFPILLSTDLDASRTFYHDILGLEILREDEGDRIVFRCGAGTQLVVTSSTVGTSDTQTQMAWRVPGHPRRPRRPSRSRRPHRGVRGARPGDDGRRRRHGSFLGGVVPRPEPERPGGRPAEALRAPRSTVAAIKIEPPPDPLVILLTDAPSGHLPGRVGGESSPLGRRAAPRIHPWTSGVGWRVDGMARANRALDSRCGWVSAR